MKKAFFKHSLCVLLALVMTVSLFTSVPLTAGAADSTVTISTQADMTTLINNINKAVAASNSTINGVAVNNTITTILVADDITSSVATNKAITTSGNILSVTGTRDITIKSTNGSKKTLKGYAFQAGNASNSNVSITFENIIIDGNRNGGGNTSSFVQLMYALGSGSSLNFKSGTVIQNYIWSSYSSIRARDKATMNFYDGSTFDNLSGVYGTFRLETGSTGNMWGGSIKNCKSLATAGTSSKEGVVYYVAGGSIFNMYGGIISDCSGSYSPGIVYLHSAGTNNTFRMFGGEIVSNSATYGGAVYSRTGSNKIIIGGSPKAVGNTGTSIATGGVASNIYLQSGRVITIDSDNHLTGEAYIGVYTAVAPTDTKDVQVATGAVKNDLKYIHSDLNTNAGLVFCDGAKDYIYHDGNIVEFSGAHHTHAANTVWLTTAAKHTHSFVYSAAKNVLTATCEDPVGTCYLDNTSISLTLVKPPKSKVDDGKSANVTVAGLDAFNSITEHNVLQNDIKYYNNDGAQLSSAPTAAGTYTAKLTVEGQTAVLEYTIAPKIYNVTWKNYDNTTLATESYELGATPSYKSTINPTRPSDAQYSYIFSGWSPTISAVTGNATYTAQFTPTTRSYTVTWKNYDGEVLETDENVPYGATPTYDGKVPTKPADAQYTYTFSGWLPKISAVTGDVTYTATYTAEENPDDSIKFHVNEPGAADRLFRVYGADESSGHNPENGYHEIGADGKIKEFYDIPAFAGDNYVFAGWYYDRVNGTTDGDTPLDFDSALPDNLRDVYAHWIEVGKVSKDAVDDKILPSSMNNQYRGFELFGIQIRPDGKRDLNVGYDAGPQPGGLRFVTSISESLLRQVDTLSDKTVGDNDSRVEYGFAVAKTKMADTWAGMVADKFAYQIGYNGTNVNGVDTTKQNYNTQKFVTNIDCTAKDYSGKGKTIDHRNYGGYRLATLVITYDSGENADRNESVLARAYIRYVDANGLLRTFYNNYGGTNTYGGCAASYNSALALSASNVKTVK